MVGRRTAVMRGLAGLAGVALLTGCGGDGGVSQNVRRSASERPDVGPAQVTAGGVTIPGDAVFNLTSFKSGQAGTARGTAEAVGANGATCLAEASDGGSAWGEFQLGYCFDNESGVPLEAAVKLRLTATESASDGPVPGSPQPGSTAGQAGGETKSTNALRFFIKDTNGLVIKEEDLLSSDLAKGPDSSGTTYDLVFDARFEPNRGYYLVLGGRTEVQAEESHRVSASLSVGQCGFQIEWREARPVAGVSAPSEVSLSGGPDNGDPSGLEASATSGRTDAP